MPRPLSFEDALFNLKLGKVVALLHWEPSEWLVYVPEAGFQVPHKYGGGYRVLATIWKKTKDDALIPWSMPQDELLDDQWAIVEPVRQDQLTHRKA